MAKQYYEGEVTKHTDWGGDESTNNLPMSGERIQAYIKGEFSKRFGAIGETNTEYLFFADEEDKGEYEGDNEKTNLIIGRMKKTGEEALASNKIDLRKIVEENSITVNKGDSVILEYFYDHVNKDTLQSTGTPAEVTIKIGNDTRVETVFAGTTNRIDVTKNLVIGNTTSVTVTARAIDSNIHESLTWQITVLNMKVTSSFNYVQTFQIGNTIAIPIGVSGGTDSNLEVFVDGVRHDKACVASLPSANFNTVVEFETYNLTHGVHSFQFVATRTIGGRTVKSNSIYFDLPIISDEHLHTPGTPLLVATKFEYEDGTIIEHGQRPAVKTTQYGSYKLNFAVYNPNGESVLSTYEVYENGVQVSHGTAAFEEIKIERHATTVGTITGFISSDVNSLTYNYSVIVSQGPIRVERPTAAMALELSASGRTNNDTNKDSWEYKGITTTFNGMMWSTSDGWTGKTLKLVGDSGATINYSPFDANRAGASNATATVIKYKVSNAVNENAEIIKCVDSHGIGFVITPQEVRFTTRNKATVSSKMASGETYEVAFVTMPFAVDSSSKYEKVHTGMCMLFINGINSGCVQLRDGDSPLQLTSANIQIAACSAAVEVSVIRCFNAYLTDKQVLDLYISDQDDTNKMVELHTANDILDSEGNISVDSVPNGMRVVIVTGKQTNGMATVMQAAVTNNKKTKFNVDSILSYIQGDVDTSRNFHVSNGCISLQGTSSLAYPIKNYRIYTYDMNKNPGVVTVGCNKNGEGGTIKRDSKVAFKTGAAPVKCWCLKADAAESSSSHNTGVARLVHETMKRANQLTPPQKYVDREAYPYDVRTTIDGEPCMFFYRKELSDVPVFLGKYNFNNDKSTEAVFGFLDINGYHDNEEWFPEGNTTECWEFLNNDYPMGMFKDDDFDTRVPDGKGGTIPNWLNVFEARFPDDDDINAQYEDGTKRPYYLENIVKWIKSTDTEEDGLTDAQKEERRQKFTTELKYYFDVDYLCDYYEFTDILAAVDQRVKNMMMAIWYTPNAEEHEIMGKMRAYMIFYDNDTILGVRNDGRNKYNWDIDENSIDEELTTASNTVYSFAGHNSVLWKNLRDCFSGKLIEAYTRLRMVMSNEDMLYYLDTTQSEMWPEVVFNVDAVNKYISPKTEGVEVMENGSVTYRTYDYMEQLQGSRKSHRHWFIYNRMQLLDAWSGAGTYPSTDISWKGTSPNGSISATMARQYYLQFIRESQVVDNVKLEADQPYSYHYDQAANEGTVFHLLGGKWMKTLDLSGWGGFTDLSFPTLPVLEYLKLGDLNSLNNSSMNAITIESPVEPRFPQLKTLIVQGWPNLTGLTLTQCTRLETVDLRGCTSLTNLRLAQGSPIKTLRLPGGLTSIKLEYLPDLTTWNDYTSKGLEVQSWESVIGLTLTNCTALLSNTSIVVTWLHDKAIDDELCELNLTGINWTDVPVSFLDRLASLGKVRLTGRIALSTTPTSEEVLRIVNNFGNVFNNNSPLRVTASGDLFAFVSESNIQTGILEGGSASNPTVINVVVLDPDVENIQITATPSDDTIQVVVDEQNMQVKVWSAITGTSNRRVDIEVTGTKGTSSNNAVSEYLPLQIIPFTYPDVYTLKNISNDSEQKTLDQILFFRAGDTMTIETVPASGSGFTGRASYRYTVINASDGVLVNVSAKGSGEASKKAQLSIGADSGEGTATIRVEVFKEGQLTLYKSTEIPITIIAANSDIVHTKDMDPVFMQVCHDKGWAANPDFMTKTEAEAVTSVDSIFVRGRSYTDLTALKYFTGLTSLNVSCSSGGNYYDVNIGKISTPSSLTSFRSTKLKATEVKIYINPMNPAIFLDSAFGRCSITDLYLFGATIPQDSGNGVNGQQLMGNIANGSIVRGHVPANVLEAWQNHATAGPAAQNWIAITDNEI